MKLSIRSLFRIRKDDERSNETFARKGSALWQSRMIYGLSNSLSLPSILLFVRKSSSNHELDKAGLQVRPFFFELEQKENPTLLLPKTENKIRRDASFPDSNRRVCLTPSFSAFLLSDFVDWLTHNFTRVVTIPGGEQIQFVPEPGWISRNSTNKSPMRVEKARM